MDASILALALSTATPRMIPATAKTTAAVSSAAPSFLAKDMFNPWVTAK